MSPIERFDEEIAPAEFDDLKRIRRQRRALGCLFLLLVLAAAAAWFVLKGWPALRDRRQSAGPGGENTEEYWQKDKPIPGVDYFPDKDDGD